MKSLFLIFACVLSVRFYAQVDSAYKETGIASFYAKKFNGRKCSNGERFSNDSLTAAHKRLAFGTVVKSHQS